MSAAEATAPEKVAIERWQRLQVLAGDIRREAVEELLLYLGDAEPFVRWQASQALLQTARRLQGRARLGLLELQRAPAEFTYHALLEAMRRGMVDVDPLRRAATVDALALWDYAGAPALVLSALQDDDPTVRVSAAAALGKLRDEETVPALVSALSDASLWVRRQAADALGAIASSGPVTGLSRAASDPQPLVRASVACALGHIPSGRSRDALARCAYDADATVRWCAARGLGEIGDVTSLPVLADLRGDKALAYGRSVADVARQASSAIRARDRGLGSVWHRLRAAWRHRWERRRLRA